MKKRLPLIILLALLGYLFWLSADFATLAAGVAIFLFGMALLEMGFMFRRPELAKVSGCTQTMYARSIRYRICRA